MRNPSITYIQTYILTCKQTWPERMSPFSIACWTPASRLRRSASVWISSALSKPRCPGVQRCHTCASGFSWDCTQKSVVYRLNCKLCQEKGQPSIYVGEMKRPVWLRFSEHIWDAHNATEGTPNGDHFGEHHSAPGTRHRSYTPYSTSTSDPL